MGKLYKNQNGFGGLELILILIIIVLIGAVGFLVYRQKEQKPKIVTVTQSVTKNVNSNSSSANTSAPNWQIVAYPNTWLLLTSQTYSYSLSYPGQSQIEKFSNTSYKIGNLSSPSSDSISYSIGPNTDLAQAVSELSIGSDEKCNIHQHSQQRYSFKGNPATKVILECDANSPLYYYEDLLISYNGNVYEFDSNPIENPEQNYSIFQNQVISSLLLN